MTICTEDPDGFCAAAFIARSIPLCVISGCVLWSLAISKQKIRVIPLMIWMELLIGSVFYWAGLFPSVRERAVGFESVCYYCWEAASLALFLSWRMIRVLAVKMSSKTSEPMQKRLILFVFVVSSMLILILLPTSIASGYVDALGWNFLNDVIYVHLAIYFLLVALGTWWFIQLRRVLRNPAHDCDQMQKVVARLTRVLGLMLLSFVVAVVYQTAAVVVGQDDSSTIVLEMLWGFTVQLALGASQWPPFEAEARWAWNNFCCLGQQSKSEPPLETLRSRASRSNVRDSVGHFDTECVEAHTSNRESEGHGDTRLSHNKATDTQSTEKAGADETQPSVEKQSKQKSGQVSLSAESLSSVESQQGHEISVQIQSSQPESSPAVECALPKEGDRETRKSVSESSTQTRHNEAVISISTPDVETAQEAGNIQSGNPM